MMVLKLITLLFILIISISYINGINIKEQKQQQEQQEEVDSDDNGLINVFLIPHSHCDVGWIETAETYFIENVTVILDQVVDTLVSDPTKKFNWVEIFFFKSWWDEQTAFRQSQVRNLVFNKQLYFVSGGWAMNDEAVTHYQAVINQMTLGHQFLLSEFGVVPECGWQIDPFGPSTLTATLFSLMGFKYHVINRIDERIKYVFNNTPDDIPGSGWMSTDRSFEFIWYPSQNYQDLSIFTHILDHHYNSPYLIYPNATNPNISITTGFDFEGDPGINPPINETNIHERACTLVEIIKQRSALYRHNNLLVPFGNDFRYQNASLEFKNMDKLIQYINANQSGFGVYINYATLNEYFETVERESKYNESSPTVVFPELVAEDYFVYTMCLSVDFVAYNSCANYWSGYYTSYPLLKQTVRNSDSILRNGELLYSLSCSYSNGFDFDFNVGFYALDFHRNVSGILTHHDAVTGTSKFMVRENYFEMLDEAQSLTLDYNVPDLIGFLLSNKSINKDYSSDPDILLNAVQGDIVAVSFSNSLAWDRLEFISLSIPFLNIAVYDFQLNSVTTQIVQRLDKGGLWYLYLPVATPALGISTYFIVFLSSDGEFVDKDLYSLLKSPISSEVTLSSELSPLTSSSISIGNSIFNLNFQYDSGNGGLLTLNSFDDLVRNIHGIPLTQRLTQYKSMNDDAYKFRVNGTSVPLAMDNPQFYLTIGPVVQIVTIVYNSNNSQSYLVYNSSGINLSDYQFGGDIDGTFNNSLIKQDQYFEIDSIVACGWDIEVAMKFTTPIENGGKFFTNNGMEMMKREYEIHWNDTHLSNEITGNFYPVVNQGYISDQTNQLTILTKQTVGASSQTPGEFELLLIRRSNYTQWSIHEPMNDTSNPLITVRVLFNDPIYNELIRTPHSILFENPLLPVYSNINSNEVPLDKYTQIYNTLSKPLQSSFPYNLHLVTFTKQWIDSPSIIMRLLNIYEVGQSVDYSTQVNFSMNNFLTHYNITDIFETTLSANTVLNQFSDHSSNLIISLNPLQLKTFLLTLSPK